jgi:hypothetical protein
MLDIKNEAKTIFLHNRLYTMKMEEGDSMEEFIDSVKNVIMILKNIGEEVKDKTLVGINLHVFPTS